MDQPSWNPLLLTICFCSYHAENHLAGQSFPFRTIVLAKQILILINEFCLWSNFPCTVQLFIKNRCSLLCTALVIRELIWLAKQLPESSNSIEAKQLWYSPPWTIHTRFIWVLVNAAGRTVEIDSRSFFQFSFALPWQHQPTQRRLHFKKVQTQHARRTFHGNIDSRTKICFKLDACEICNNTNHLCKTLQLPYPRAFLHDISFDTGYRDIWLIICKPFWLPMFGLSNCHSTNTLFDMVFIHRYDILMDLVRHELSIQFLVTI